MSHCNCPFDDNVDLVSLDRDRLSLLFASSCKPISAFKIGIEHERFGVNKRNFDPVQYEGHDGVTGLFQEFVDRYGWEAQSEVPGGPVISLRRGTAAITLEPAAQFEFSGSPCVDLHTLEHERTIHANELRTISNEKGIMWQASGFHPFAKHEQLSWVPKLRYGIMREYLATQGTDALEMMCRTATVQANFDYCSIEDGLRKLRVALKISPIVSAMFANGPIVEGKPYGGKSRRIQTWLSVDPARQGILPQMWSENASLDAYIDWGLDAPMFLFMRDGKAVKNTGQSFRSFILDGFGGYRAKLSDWTSHINTLFPEVRLKETIETRGADSVPDRYATALPALWTGLLYDDTSLSKTEELTRDFCQEEMAELRTRLGDEGLNASYGGKSLIHWSEKLLSLAVEGLDRRGKLDDNGRTESVYLDELTKLIGMGMCPADEVMKELDGDYSRESIARTTQVWQYQ